MCVETYGLMSMVLCLQDFSNGGKIKLPFSLVLEPDFPQAVGRQFQQRAQYQPQRNAFRGRQGNRRDPYAWNRVGPAATGGGGAMRPSRRERRGTLAQDLGDPLRQCDFGFNFPVALYVRFLTLLTENQKAVLARKLREPSATQIDKIEDTMHSVRVILGNKVHAAHFEELRGHLAGLRAFHAQVGHGAPDVAADPDEEGSTMEEAPESRPVTPTLPPLPKPGDLFAKPTPPTAAEELAQAAEDLAAKLAAMPGKPSKESGK